jgi:hypothetical protein
MMSGMLIKTGKSNGLVNMYLAVPADDSTHVSTERVIFVPVPLDSTFKAEVAKVAD